MQQCIVSLLRRGLSEVESQGFATATHRNLCYKIDVFTANFITASANLAFTLDYTVSLEDFFTTLRGR